MEKQGPILIVEDEPSISEMLEALLVEEGYQVVKAENGRVGLRYLSEMEVKPALVLSDIMMPVMDGREMIGHLKTNPAYSDIPVILMSAANQPGNLPDLNYNAFLAKPFNITTLLETVERLIKRQA